MYHIANARRNNVRTRIVVIVTGVLLAAAIGWNVAGCGSSDQAEGSAAAIGTPTQTLSPADGSGTGGDGGARGTGVGAVDGDDGTGPGDGVDGNGGGSGGDGGAGGEGGDGGDPPGPGPDEDGQDEAQPVEPSPKDCVSYNPENLTVQSAGASSWLMVDGAHSMALFDTEADAEDGVKVARNYKRSCFIGRANTRPQRERYIVRYWESPSGLPLGLAPKLDCVLYNPVNLTIEKYGDAGWRLVDGDHSMLLLDTEQDAARAKLVASAKSKLCFIGRGNTRPDRYRYIVEYWLG